MAAFADIDLDATIVTAVSADAGGLDQLRSGSHINYISHFSVHDGPITFHPETGAVIPHLVAPEFVDEVTMVGTVTPAPFHDGSILTAEDLVFTYERAGNVAEYHNGGEDTDHPAGWTSARESLGSQNWARSEATDERTWTVEVNEADASWVIANISGSVSTLSKAYTERVGDAEMDRAPMGTGPYRFVSHTDDTDFVFTRFDDHFNPLDHPLNVTHVPFHKDFTVLVRPEVLSMLAGLEAGEIDALFRLSTTDIEAFVDDEDFNVLFGGDRPHFVYFNLNNPVLDDGSPNPFLDVRVRRAANLAINRQAIIDNLLTGTEEQPLAWYDGTFGYPSPEQKAEVLFPYDVDAAKALMAEAGYADGFDTTFHVVINFAPFVEDMALIAQQDLAAIGIRLQIREYTTAEYFTDAGVRGRPGAPGLWYFFGCRCPDPQTMIAAAILPGGNYAVSPGTPHMLELAAQQKVELDPVKRAELVTELMLEHTREAMHLFLLETKNAALTPANVRWPATQFQNRDERHFFTVRKLI